MPEKIATVDTGPSSSRDTAEKVYEHNEKAYGHNRAVDAVPGVQARAADAQRQKDQAEKDLQNAQNALANAHQWEIPERQNEVSQAASRAGAAQGAWRDALGRLNQDEAEANRDVSREQKEAEDLKQRVAWDEEHLPKPQPTAAELGLRFMEPVLPVLAAPTPAEAPPGAPATDFDGKPITYTEYQVRPQKITIENTPFPKLNGLTYDIGVNVDVVTGSNGTVYTRSSPSEPYHREF